MAVGNPQIIQYLHTYKSQMDSSHFQPILLAAVAALTGDQSWIEERNRIYEQRRDLVVHALKKAGFHVEPPAAAIYVWAHLPAGYEDSTAFCTQLLEETGVSITLESFMELMAKATFEFRWVRPQNDCKSHGTPDLMASEGLV